jgi:hypothetical protein
MKNTPTSYSLIGIVLVAVFMLVSCSPAATPLAPATVVATQPPVPVLAAPTATQPPVPTATDTPAPAATATTAPTSTLAATATTHLTAQLIPTINAYCRKGPGTYYYEITYLQQGTAYNVVGRNSLNTWWLVQAPGNVTCWTGDPGATQQGPVDQAAIALVQPLPVAPATFVDSYTCNATLHTLSVAFNWSEVANVTGYRIYRNGTQITDVGPTATAYTDSSAPQKTDLIYALEAHNDYGVAPQITVSVPSCN